MSDARISTGLPSHPKTKKLMRRLGAAGPWALVCLFLWARDNRSDGDLCGMTDEDIELASDWTGDDGALVAALVSVGFLDGDESSRTIHDWASHQPWSAGADARSQSSKWAALCKRYGRDEAAQRMPEYANRTRPVCDPHAELCDPHADPTDPQCPASASASASASESKEQKPLSPLAPTKRAYALPSDWKPTDEMIAKAKADRPDIDVSVEADKFRDYWTAKGGKEGRKLDWDATWRNWVRNARSSARGVVANNDWRAVAV